MQYNSKTPVVKFEIPDQPRVQSLERLLEWMLLKEYHDHYFEGLELRENGHLVFLEQAGRGMISGAVVEWPQLKPACLWAAEKLRK